MERLDSFEEFPITSQHIFSYKMLYQPGQTFPSHYHNEVYEIIYMKRGCLNFLIGGQVVTACQGDLLFIREGEIHEGINSDINSCFYTILFNRGRLVKSDLTNSELAPLLTFDLNIPPVLRPEDPQYNAVSELIFKIVDEFDSRNSGYEIAIKSYLFLLIIAMARFCPISEKGLKTRETERRNLEKLKEVIAYIEDGGTENVTVERAAAIANMSVYHFCRVFKATIGRTFIEYVQLHKMNKAEELIRTTDWTITKISQSVGIYNLNYFSRLFRKYKNDTPVQYRKKCQSQN